MSPSNRTNFISDIFARGLPADLMAMLGLDARTWLLLNVPIDDLVEKPDAGLPASLDAIAGRLVPRHKPDLAEVQRRARWHFPRREQEQARRRLAADLALSGGLLHPSLDGLFALHLYTPCDGPDPDALATTLMEVGFPRVVVLVGEDGPGTGDEVVGATSLRSRVDEVEERLRLVLAGEPVPVRSARAAAASKPLRDRMHRLLHGVHMPRRLPVVLDLSPTGR